jgi:hypothetical protein
MIRTEASPELTYYLNAIQPWLFKFWLAAFYNQLNTSVLKGPLQFLVHKPVF